MKKIKTIFNTALAFSIMYFLNPFIILPPLPKFAVLFLCAFGAFWFLEGVYITYLYIKDQKKDTKKLNYTITQVNEELSILDKKINEAESKRAKNN